MTRTETIATITATLSSLDEKHVLTVADIVAEMAAGSAEPYPLRDLTPHELAFIEQSKADFAAGRTSTLEESEAFVMAELARRRAARAGA